MPTYPYKCNNCGNRWNEEFSTIQEYQKAKADNNIECPKCQSYDIFRCIEDIITVVYKDFGFYTTDNKADKEICRRNKEREKAKEKKYYTSIKLQGE